jgi:hypothetical protein
MTATLTILLPERRRFAGQNLSVEAAKIFGRSDKLPTLSSGEQAQLERHISLLPKRWPVAALTRQYDAQDATHHAWLRADPAHVRAEMGVVRLLACGDLGLTQQEADELIKPLKIVFGDIGFPLSATTPSRWYLMLPKESKLPVFKAPDEALGADIFSGLPADENAKRWRALLNEAQIILHNHPVNAKRVEQGLLPVNSLYFWGGGALPDQVRFHADDIVSDDVLVLALKMQSGMKSVTTPAENVVQDCRKYRDLNTLEHEHLLPAIEKVNAKKIGRLILDFADGGSIEIKASQKWRFWRKPASAL